MHPIDDIDISTLLIFYYAFASFQQVCPLYNFYLLFLCYCLSCISLLG